MLYLQVDCAWCVASHDRQSPHFYALCDAPFQNPNLFGWGFFMFRMNGMPRAQGGGETGNRSRGWPGPCAGAACVSFAQHPNAHVNFARPKVLHTTVIR